ncbi:uncharacterized protein Z518_11393 [Rhinocladiella mackenziei CBS 650.93]|uniref:Rhinocladiella mackenziei CBS 650.93 unplaced genomic scaffold supercont1.13, whole genome shotgun sequence n=1 Tax=Rhinocladiella mackenziei CBS 650.93 TaxID=1442369 RepID=A0A0D2I839_9EURO|nr:uncharacterized protein Z518_11393 [Rhinocladiella mackenziei CBS 650.93]KIW99405.1 hypothetical protein Z518_11393 [Rhinocladiella mackenziei CBS 650.93]
MGSPPFEFLVGVERTAFHVHSSLAIHLSPVFAVLIQGHMLEAIEKRAVLDDIDVDTFVRFCEYAYTGDYSVPQPTICQAPHPSPLLQTDTQDSNDNSKSNAVSQKPETEKAPPPDSNPRSKQLISRSISWLTGRNNKKKPCTPSCKLRNPASGVIASLPDPDSKLGVTWSKFRASSTGWNGPVFQPYRNILPSESFTEVLLCQARLYVFGDRYDIKPLRLLIVYKIRRTLSVLKIFPERVPEIFQLVAYVYENTVEGDDLRMLVLQYTACMTIVLMADADWDAFISEQPTFARELLAYLSNLEQN